MKPLALLPGLLLLGMACGSAEVRVFDVTFRTVRNCHPAGIITELCEDRSTFEGKTRTGRLYLESRGATQFILYEDDGRALPGQLERDGFLERDVVQQREAPVRRQYYFARQSAGERYGDCLKQSERNFKFRIEHALVPGADGAPQAARIQGNLQDRASQTEACGHATQSRYEEAFEGTEVSAGEGVGPFLSPAPLPQFPTASQLTP